MFDRDGFKEYVGTNSGSSYVNGLDNVEKVYGVDIDAEIRKNKCAHLLSRIDSDKKKMSGNDRHNRQNWFSHLKKYVSYIDGKAIANIPWMPFYVELADKLLAYKQERQALLTLLHKLFHDIGMKSPFMEKDVPMSDVDPFTIFGCFNKGISNANRIKTLQGFKQAFSVDAEVPTNFDGIPVLNNFMAVFFAFQNDPRRGPQDIDNLWDLFCIAIDYADAPTQEKKDHFIEIFDVVKEQAIIRWNITMGLFWVRPYSFINLDERNRQYLGMGKAIPPVDTMIASKLKNVPSGAEYLGIIEDCKKAFQNSYTGIKNFVDLSQRAWIATTSEDEDTMEGFWPSIEEYNPQLSKENWKKYILEVELPDHPSPMQMLKALMQEGGQASCKRLAEIYGGTPSRYVGCTMNLGRRVKKYFNLPACMDDGQERYFAIPFVGKRMMEGNTEYYVYRIRPELYAALKEIDLSAVSLNVTGEEDEVMESKTDISLNTILYGPPGTGKTYHTVIYAVAIIENKELATVAEEAYSAVLARYKEYRAQGRIEFTTFHQSYGYEEFIEGIRPTVVDDGDQEESGNIQYSVQPGVFKKFCEKADRPISVHSSTTDFGINEDATIWKVSLWSTGDNEVRTECLKNGHIRIGWDQYGKDITDETDFSVDGGRVVLNAFMNKMQIGDIVLSCYSASTIDAIGVVTGEYEWHDEYYELKRLRKVNWIVKNIRENIMAINGGTAMTLASVYRLSNIAISDVYKLIEKHKPATLLPASQKENYVFIIDEINRGNISKIFGELITLIEETKRVGKEEEATAILPYSQKSFGVPKNVYIIGTMNTADRSIATIDTALRRRFFFKEMMPKPDVLAGISIDGVSVRDMIERMNKRIAVLYDREHTIGHAYFMPLKVSPTIDTLAEIFANNIIPLLQEYFYEDYEKIRLVLGDNRKSTTEEQFIIAKENNYAELFGDADIGLDDGCSYEINYAALKNVEAYRSI